MGSIKSKLSAKPTGQTEQAQIQQLNCDFNQIDDACEVEQESYTQKKYKNNRKERQELPIGKLTLLPSKAEPNNKVVAVIVSFCCDGSYDNLFTTVEQKTLDGTRVLVYSCDSSYLPRLIKAYEGQPQDEVAAIMMGHIKDLDADCVVFNWECCGGYSSKHFPQGKDYLFKFLRMIIDRGHMSMFSDFSLKALINEWNEKEIGPNPFKQIGEHTGNFQVRFRIPDLKQCPSAQLQIIGDMADSGFCNVVAAGGTIVYGVNQKKLHNDVYTLQVLTVVPTLHVKDDNLRCKIDQYEGAAGHVLLKYKSGGMILTSMGHWIELMKIDTSEKKLFEVAEREFGKQYASKMKKQYEVMDIQQQCEYLQMNAKEFVRNQAPCSNMNRKAVKKF